MSWLLWRQNRLQIYVTAAALALFALILTVTGVHMAHVYDHAVRHCQDCLNAGQLFRGYGAIIDIVTLSIAVPILLGVFLGATVVARETESSTHVLAWTQAITRRQWVVAKVAAAVAATLVWSAALTVMVTWWSTTMNTYDHNRFQPVKFDTQNLMPIAFALFAVALGIAAGAFLRRTLPAIGVTIAGYLAVRIPVEVYLRPHLASTRTLLDPLGVPQRIADNAWVLSSDLIGPDGTRISGPIRPDALCPSAVDRTSVAECMTKLGYHVKTIYHPASQYWHLQWMESGLYVTLAALLLVAGVVWTLRHDA
jgi:hypothetical protein